jgi:hypothetical protein
MRSAVATVLRAPYDFARRYRMSCFAKLRSERPSCLGTKFSGLSFPALVVEIELDRGPPSYARQRKVRNAAADVRLGS